MSLTIDASYSGLQYAFLASGGFFADQQFRDISMSATTTFNQYNVTTALQVTFDVRFLNSKLGLWKDSDNSGINLSTFDPSNLLFPFTEHFDDPYLNDDIEITHQEFVDGIQYKEQVMSVGGLKNIYTEFNNFVTDYFGNRFGFETLFDFSGQALYNNGIFDASALKNIISYDPAEQILDLSGSIKLSNVNEMLNYVVYKNPFGNRSHGFDSNGNVIDYEYDSPPVPYMKPLLDVSNNIVWQDITNKQYFLKSDGKYYDNLDNTGVERPSTTKIYPVYTNDPMTDASGDVIYRPKHDISKGFLDGDLIFVEKGFTVKLHLDIINNNIDLNQVGLGLVESYEQKNNVNQAATTTQGYKQVITQADDKRIFTIINVPLLIKLKNLTTGPSSEPYNYTNFISYV